MFDGLYKLIAQSLVGLHKLVGGGDSGWSWALAIVLLTVAIRLLLFPLFVKQIRAQRVMAELQPKIKALQAKHKGDRETLNQEMMKLYREHGANPLAGCLPLIVQAPIFFALFQVLRQLSPSIRNGELVYQPKFGVDLDTAMSLGQAKIFDAPIAAGFTSKPELLEQLRASVLSVRVLALTLIVAMAVTTFLTSRQMMARNTPTDPQQALQQKLLLYLMPILLAVFGFGVAIGTLIYWTTTNVFSMVQQTLVIHRLGTAGGASSAGGGAGAPAKPRPGGPGAGGPGGAGSGGPGSGKATRQPAPKASVRSAAESGGDEPGPDGPAEPARPQAGAAKRPGGNRNSKRGKGSRRGGRR